MAQTLFVRLSSNYDWVETGARQYPTDSTTQTHAWEESSFYSGGGFTITSNQNLDSCCQNGGAGILSTGTKYVFELSNGTGSTWRIYIIHSANPDSAGYKQIYTSPELTGYTGYIESESARFGNSDAKQWASKLEGQQQFSSDPWTAWAHLACDYSQRSQFDWKAVKVSDQEWQNVAGAPGAGQC